jgi:hypothetical protein
MSFSPDVVNGLFEFGGSLMLWRNVYQLYKDKMVRGVHWGPTAFFMSWGFWNLYFYPHLDQIWSFAGGISIVLANTVWFFQMLKYRKN